ncbi:MAG: nucleoside hydrolase [Limnochordia bacterium]
MNSKSVSDEHRLALLEPPTKRVRMVLDTDTYNEIDDQFALVYALLSPDQLDLQAVYAAPFHNPRSSGPADGMEKSYEEILRLLELCGRSAQDFAFKGCTAYLSPDGEPERSPAVLDLVERALAASADDPLYVVAVGAITNVASAMLLEPRILERIVVVWLGGHALHFPHTKEFNLQQDVLGARTILDSGVPFVHVPCMGVTTHLTTTVPEIERYVAGQGAVGDYLAKIFKEYLGDHFARSKVLWDVAAVAYLVNSAWLPNTLVHSPRLTDQLTWSFDHTRHWMRYVYHVQRDPIFRDLFTKLKSAVS